ncbi:MAG: hypothetical protein M3140_11935, partial [Actinomycetota bacterium]|nr:hypothetical protein [Actinomycetota bacterium]
ATSAAATSDAATSDAADAEPSSAAAARLVAALTRDITEWVDPASAGGAGYGGAAAFGEESTTSVGFRYRAGEAVPTVVGGEFLDHLRTLRDASPDRDGSLAGAALLRMPVPGEPVLVRFVYGRAAAQITWTAADEVLAGRLRPTGATGPIPLARRPSGDLLDVSALLDRARADVLASLRSHDGWQRFAFAVDAADGHSAAFTYDADGQPAALAPLFSPLADLIELRAQTVRTDGAQWAGAVMSAWAGTDRVDVSFFGADGIAGYLGGGPDRVAAALLPPPQPPETAPQVPWPPSGGRLNAAALLHEVSVAMLRSPDLSHDDWDRLAVVLVFGGSAAGPTAEANALRFTSAGRATVTAIPELGPVGKLRRATGGGWEVGVLQGGRGSSELTPYYLTGENAEPFRLDARTIAGAAEQLRPA